MIYQFDYYVKRWKTGGYYAVCFSSVTKVDPKLVIANVNKQLDLKDEPGTVYDVMVIEIPTGKEEYYQVTTEKENDHDEINAI